jgi:hypothetical protein
VAPINSPLTPSKDDSVDYDAMYDENDDDEDVDMKNHGSVLTHLLSQVRIGMDLTKIVLPTFILERRSLLEMYSDFFAHPGKNCHKIKSYVKKLIFNFTISDIFVSVTDGKTPEDRMLRVLRWYLSSFHAGRKSSIAKKPYNPIIGETFRCHWELDESKQGGDDDGQRQKPAAYKDSPLPWCTKKDLTFIAEQVNSQCSDEKHFAGLSVKGEINDLFLSRCPIILLFLHFTPSTPPKEYLSTHTSTQSRVF